MVSTIIMKRKDAVAPSDTTETSEDADIEPPFEWKGYRRSVPQFHSDLSLPPAQTNTMYGMQFVVSNLILY